MQYLKTMMVLLAMGGLTLAGCPEDDTDADGAAGAAGTGGTGGDGGSGGSGGTGGQNAQEQDIVATAIAAGNFTKLAEALTTANLVGALQGEGPFTVFAPSDEAFAAFDAANPGVLASLSVDQLTEILTYHVVPSVAVASTGLQDGQLVETLAGPVLAVDLSDGVKINEAKVVTADIEASNGVIHVIDTIILPPGDIVEVAVAAGSFTKLAAALTDADLVTTLQGEGPFTVFAPTDAAFTALGTLPTGDALKNVLLYHVIPGVIGPLDLVDDAMVETVNGASVTIDLDDGPMVDDAKITMTNVVASNGVIHVIDAVLVP